MRRASSRPPHDDQHPGVVDAALLLCGAAYGLVYVVLNDVVAAGRYPGYSRLDQAVSELSAVGAPPQALLRWTTPVFFLLMAGFAVGVWRAVGHRTSGRVLAATVAAFAVTGLMWLPFPMTSREDLAAGVEQGGDTGHLVLAGVSVALFLLQFGVGAWLLRGWFAVYSLVSLAVCLTAGAAVAAMSPRLPAGEATPYLGLLERVNMGTWFVWMAVLGLVLIRRGRGGAPSSGEAVPEAQPATG
jgi:hypothetical protein